MNIVVVLLVTGAGFLSAQDRTVGNASYTRDEFQRLTVNVRSNCDGLTEDEVYVEYTTELENAAESQDASRDVFVRHCGFLLGAMERMGETDSRVVSIPIIERTSGSGRYDSEGQEIRTTVRIDFRDQIRRLFKNIQKIKRAVRSENWRADIETIKSGDFQWPQLEAVEKIRLLENEAISAIYLLQERTGGDSYKSKSP
ncbi:MAG: hypothetical protein HYT79_03980 [Elusimicrobia bacterium]|nr:hypothetical protein [Elusimicrobiota bacterium]